MHHCNIHQYIIQKLDNRWYRNSWVDCVATHIVTPIDLFYEVTLDKFYNACTYDNVDELNKYRVILRAVLHKAVKSTVRQIVSFTYYFEQQICYCLLKKNISMYIIIYLVNWSSITSDINLDKRQKYETFKQYQGYNQLPPKGGSKKCCVSQNRKMKTSRMNKLFIFFRFFPFIIFIQH